jgi:hypothetical protein
MDPNDSDLRFIPINAKLYDALTGIHVIFRLLTLDVFQKTLSHAKSRPKFFKISDVPETDSVFIIRFLI